MLFKRPVLEGIAAGNITLAFRRWKRPTVKTGGQLRTEVGVLAIDAVEQISADAITEREAQQAGYSSRTELLKELDKRSDGTIYCIKLHLAGEDPRAALREQSDLTDEDMNILRQKLQQLDAKSRNGPWTLAVLLLIRGHPEVRAAELAALVPMETQAFKTKVRKLKELGLTESIARGGYRLSPRGNEVLNQCHLTRRLVFT